MKKIPGLICLVAVASFATAQPVSTNAAFTPRELQIIAAARPAPKPCFNGATVIGVRPNMPVIYALKVSGTRPLEFSAKQLPAGLTLDSKTGIITGTLTGKGEFNFTASAKNSAGKAKAEIKIICGDTLALTPPLGWNSYDAFGHNVVGPRTRCLHVYRTGESALLKCTRETQGVHRTGWTNGNVVPTVEPEPIPLEWTNEEKTVVLRPDREGGRPAMERAPIERILCPIDFSEFSILAYDYATSLD